MGQKLKQQRVLAGRSQEKMSTHGVVSSKSRRKENREGLGGKKDTTKGPPEE